LIFCGFGRGGVVVDGDSLLVELGGGGGGGVTGCSEASGACFATMSALRREAAVLFRGPIQATFWNVN
jgi:hypothetical protein